jgi:hypothetical protein
MNLISLKNYIITILSLRRPETNDSFLTISWPLYCDLSISFCSKKGEEPLKKWLILDLGQEMCKMTWSFLILESEEAL